VEATHVPALEVIHAGFEAFNRGDIEAAIELFDPEVVIHDPERTGSSFRGHDGLRSFWAEWLENWDAYRVEPREFTQRGDEVLVVGTQTGRGSLSGADVTQDIFIVYRFREGKVVEFRAFTDRGPALDSMHG
jgi:ketosteroid isomerase-like protein